MLNRTFGCVRYVYNWALRLRTDAYHNGEKINYVQSSALLTQHKKEIGFEWLNEVSSVPLQQAARQLQAAFRNFFDKRSDYPKLRKKSGAQSAEFTRSAFTWDGNNQNLSLAKIGRLDVKWSRKVTSYPTTVTVIRDAAGRYFVSLVVDEPTPSFEKSDKAVGVDLGINRLATLSGGEHILNPRYTVCYERKLARAQRILARRKTGSHRREAARLRVAKIQAKIADSRRDHLHKFTTNLVKHYGTIAIEDLNVRGMVKNHNLAKHIADGSFGAIRQMLTYKCEWYGRELIVIDRFHPSSKRCSGCGHIVESLPLNMREWTCPECGASHDRDENAAKNILAVGQAVARKSDARGGRVRRAAVSAVTRSARRNANPPVGISV